MAPAMVSAQPSNTEMPGVLASFQVQLDSLNDRMASYDSMLQDHNNEPGHVQTGNIGQGLGLLIAEGERALETPPGLERNQNQQPLRAEPETQTETLPVDEEEAETDAQRIVPDDDSENENEEADEDVNEEDDREHENDEERDVDEVSDDTEPEAADEDRTDDDAEETEAEEVEEADDAMTEDAEACRADVEAAREASAGQICTQQVMQMSCPHTESYTYTATDGCQISELEASGWTGVTDQVFAEDEETGEVADDEMGEPRTVDQDRSDEENVVTDEEVEVIAEELETEAESNEEEEANDEDSDAESNEEAEANDEESEVETDAEEADANDEVVEEAAAEESVPGPTAGLDQGVNESVDQDARSETVNATVPEEEEEADEELKQEPKLSWECYGEGKDRYCKQVALEAEEAEEDERLYGNASAETDQTGNVDAGQDADVRSDGAAADAAGSQGADVSVGQGADVEAHEPTPSAPETIETGEMEWKCTGQALDRRCKFVPVEVELPAEEPDPTEATCEQIADVLTEQNIDVEAFGPDLAEDELPANVTDKKVPLEDELPAEELVETEAFADQNIDVDVVQDCNIYAAEGANVTALQDVEINVGQDAEASAEDGGDASTEQDVDVDVDQNLDVTAVDWTVTTVQEVFIDILQGADTTSGGVNDTASSADQYSGVGVEQDTYVYANESNITTDQRTDVDVQQYDTVTGEDGNDYQVANVTTEQDTQIDEDEREASLFDRVYVTLQQVAEGAGL